MEPPDRILEMRRIISETSMEEARENTLEVYRNAVHRLEPGGNSKVLLGMMAHANYQFGDFAIPCTDGGQVGNPKRSCTSSELERLIVSAPWETPGDAHPWRRWVEDCWGETPHFSHQSLAKFDPVVAEELRHEINIRTRRVPTAPPKEEGEE